MANKDQECTTVCGGDGTAFLIPPPAMDFGKEDGDSQKVVLAAGCFWGIQGVYQHIRGVRRALSGYTGGDADRADYKSVCTGKTGHAEAVEVIFNPGEVTFGELLHVFFSVAHDPTQLNRQGADVGTQYRSAIFCDTDQQRAIASAYLSQLDKARVFPKPIATRIELLERFHPAEAYHQDYLLHNPRNSYIAHVDIPKIVALQSVFPHLFTAVPATHAGLGA